MNVNMINAKGTNIFPSQLQNVDREMRQKNAVQIILGENEVGRRDSLSISGFSRNFSKEAIGALIDNSANPTSSQLLYYFEHYNDPYALLAAINFGENVSCGGNPDFKEYGVISFSHQGETQIIPNYAVPKMNAASFGKIYAVNNTLVLNDKSYYCWTTSNGKQCTWAVSGGRIGWAASESLLSEPTGEKGTNYKWEMRKEANVLTALAQGSSLFGMDREEVLCICEKVGIEPVFFSIDVGVGKQNYFLSESGKIININAKIKQMNSMNWTEIGYEEGDIFSIYGNEYSVCGDGYLHISIPEKFSAGEIVYPKRCTSITS